MRLDGTNVRLFTPNSLSTKHAFELSLDFGKGLTTPQAGTLSTWLSKPSNWQYNGTNSKIFTNIFGGEASDIDYFKKVLFEQKLNAQRPMPSNGTIILEDWPTGLPVPTIEFVLTDHEERLDSSGNPVESGKLTNTERYTNTTSSITTIWR